MSKRANATESSQRPTNKPVIGIAATATNGNAVARTLLRAREAGYDVLVAEVDESTAGAELARSSGAEVIAVDSEDPSTETIKQALTTAAEINAYPGVIFAGTGEEWIDFERSETALKSSDSVVDAKPATGVSTTGTLVAIPAYNEAGTIAGVVEDVSKHADEVVVVDDGSDDDTVRRARQAGATVIEHEQNRGYGGALQTAFETASAAGSQHLVIIDGDGQHDPADIPDLIRALEDGADLAIGSRFVGDRGGEVPVYRRFGLAVVNALTNLSMGAVRSESRVRDTQCGFRAYGRQAIDSVASDASIGSHMGASTDILHHAQTHDYDIVEQPTTVDYEIDDTSTHNPIQHGITLIMNLVRTIEQERPISVVGVPGFLIISLGFAFGYWTLANYIRTGTFPLGLAIIATFLGLVGIFACFTAIILHSLNTHLDD